MAEHFSLHHVSILEVADQTAANIASEARVNEGRLRKVALPYGRASDTPDLANEILLSRLSQETKVLCRELAQVREHRCQQVRIQSVPTRQSSTVLIY